MRRTSIALTALLAGTVLFSAAPFALADDGRRDNGQGAACGRPSDDTRPGFGFGDRNHEHTGPRGDRSDRDDGRCVPKPSVTPTATASMTATPTGTATTSESPTASPTASATATATATATMTATPTATASTTPTGTATFTPSLSPSPGARVGPDFIGQLMALLQQLFASVSAAVATGR